MKKKYLNNRVFVLGLGLGLIVQLIYLSISSCNVPIMDYWKYINMFVEKIYNGGVSFLDIWKNDGIHRSPLQFIYFILNVKLFHMNAQVEIYLGAILMACIVVFLYKLLKKDALLNNPNRSGIFGIILLLVFFNLNQYEIINEQFALSFASRIGLFIICFSFTNKYLSNISDNKQYTFELGLLYIFIICMVGSGYFPAVVFSILVTFVFHYVVSYNKEKQNYLIHYVALMICIAIGSLLYMRGISNEAGVILETQFSFLGFFRDLVLGILGMVGVGVIGFEYSITTTLIVGMVIVSFYICSFLLYLKKRYYERTYLPLLFYLYSFGTMGIIYLGRSGLFGIDYVYSSRYVGETNFALLAFIWIVALYLNEVNGKEKIVKYAMILGVCVIVIGISTSNYKEFQIAPYRKIYGEELIYKIEHIDSLDSEEFKQFQATEENVKKGVELMKKYKLGIF